MQAASAGAAIACSAAQRQRQQRHDAALALVVGAHDEHDVLQRHHDDQRPEDQRQHAQHVLAAWRACRARLEAWSAACTAGWCRCRQRPRRWRPARVRQSASFAFRRRSCRGWNPESLVAPKGGAQRLADNGSRRCRLRQRPFAPGGSLRPACSQAAARHGSFASGIKRHAVRLDARR